MKLAILTPLFPPDNSIPAAYAKLLAKKLSDFTPDIIAYGRYPERVEGTNIHTVNKRNSKIRLIYNCLKTLRRVRPETLIVLNGLSSEVPALIYSYLSRTKIIYILNDQEAAKQQSVFKKFVAASLSARAVATIPVKEKPETFLKPEWLPFKEIEPEKETVHQNWWLSHTKEIIEYVE